MSDLYNLPIISYQEVRNRGHLQQMGIYKPAGSVTAFSIITNVGQTSPNYEDHLTDDLVLYYIGRGKEQDQTLAHYDNQALLNNFELKTPVRVFCGAHNQYRDWGNWQVIDVHAMDGPDGFVKIVYALVPTENPAPIIPGASLGSVTNTTQRQARRRKREIEQQVRYAPELRKLKELYSWRCQVESSHDTRGRNNSKVVVHHLHPVGMNGDLVTPHHSNEVVLCPNCHALFDDGSLFIDPDDGVTLRHWDRSPLYEGRKIALVEGHSLDRTILAHVYEMHYKRQWRSEPERKR